MSEINCVSKDLCKNSTLAVLYLVQSKTQKGKKKLFLDNLDFHRQNYCEKTSRLCQGHKVRIPCSLSPCQHLSSPLSFFSSMWTWVSSITEQGRGKLVRVCVGVFRHSLMQVFLSSLSLYPALQSQVKDPGELIQICSQSCFPSAHRSMAAAHTHTHQRKPNCYSLKCNADTNALLHQGETNINWCLISALHILKSDRDTHTRTWAGLAVLIQFVPWQTNALEGARRAFTDMLTAMVWLQTQIHTCSYTARLHSHVSCLCFTGSWMIKLSLLKWARIQWIVTSEDTMYCSIAMRWMLKSDSLIVF